MPAQLSRPSAHLSRFEARAPQTGLALVLVLWMLTLLTVIASSFVFSTREEIALTINMTAQVRAEALADAGIHKALYELIARPPGNPLRWKGNGASHLWQFQDGNVLITIRDEAAKIDINSASILLLKALFLHAGVAEQDADALVDASIDWRDPDSLRRLHGAEADDYLAAGRNYKPPNAPFQSIEELRLILGMSEEIYRRIAGLITVYSGQSGINAAIAPREVLLVLPGSDPAQVDAFIAAREAALASPGLPLPEFPPAQPFFSLDSRVLNIRAEAILPGGAAFVREAIVNIFPDPRRPMAYLAWHAPDRSQPAGTALLVKENNVR